MSVPNRLKEVKEIVKRYPQTFQGPADKLDARRRLLIPIIARELNKLDDDNWFLVNRLDRNDDDPKPGRLTSDVIAWGPTKEHVDVLSGSGAMWGEHPAITDPEWLLERWNKWPSWDDLGEPDVDPPKPEPKPEPFDPTPLLVEIAQLKAQVEALRTSLTQHVADIGNKLAEDDARIKVLESRKVNLPKLYVEGTTGRTWGHGHDIKLSVKVEE